MKTINKLSFLFALFFSGNLVAQVQFQLSWLPQESAYLVSMVPQTDWAAPFNITSTAQVSVKVPSEFELSNFQNLHDEVTWKIQSTFESPEEAEGFDYFNFNLVNLGTSKYSYVANQAIQLFKFQNKEGCAGIVSLVDNSKDPFMYPNSQDANIGNQITVLGAKGDAYSGIYGDGKVDCALVGLGESKFLDVETFSVFPNPVRNNIQVEWTWKESTQNVTFLIREASGKEIFRIATDTFQGDNQISIPIHNKPAGYYTIELLSDESNILAQTRFIKID